MIVMDVVERHLSDVEMASFITALHIRGMSRDEIEALTRAMVETGETLKLGKEPVLDKHSVGGIPGDKTTILVVPIVASAGFTIPKTSSRAITSPTGTEIASEAYTGGYNFPYSDNKDMTSIADTTDMPESIPPEEAEKAEPFPEDMEKLVELESDKRIKADSDNYGFVEPDQGEVEKIRLVGFKDVKVQIQRIAGELLTLTKMINELESNATKDILDKYHEFVYEKLCVTEGVENDS